MRKTKAEISAFVFATQIVQSLIFLNPKFPATSHILWLYSPVCVDPGWKTLRPVFLPRSSTDHGEGSDIIFSLSQNRLNFSFVENISYLKPFFSPHLSCLLYLMPYNNSFKPFKFNQSQTFVTVSAAVRGHF